MHQRDQVLHGQPVQGHAAAVIVGGGDQQVAGLERTLGSRVEDVGAQGAHRGFGVRLANAAAGHVDLGPGLLRVDHGGVDQPVEVAQLHHVGIDQHPVPDTQPRQVLGHRAAQPAQADDAHPQAGHLALEFLAEGPHLAVVDGRHEGRSS